MGDILHLKWFFFTKDFFASFSYLTFTHILDVVKAQRGAFAWILQRFGTESLIMTMEEAVDYKIIRLQSEARCACVCVLLTTEYCVRERFPWRQDDSLELAEDVGVLWWDTGGLQNSDAESEDTSHLQLTNPSFWLAQLDIDVPQLQIWDMKYT